jgi:hypothetical protein
MLAAYELPLAGPGALPGGVGGPAAGALALAAPPTSELDLVGVGVGVAPSTPGLLLCKGHTQGGHKEMSSIWAGPKVSSYTSDRFERKRQNAGGAGSPWLCTAVRLEQNYTLMI